jgi:hypothetical protein
MNAYNRFSRFPVLRPNKARTPALRLVNSNQGRLRRGRKAGRLGALRARFLSWVLNDSGFLFRKLFLSSHTPKGRPRK